jgi:hypothetical protein
MPVAEFIWFSISELWFFQHIEKFHEISFVERCGRLIIALEWKLLLPVIEPHLCSCTTGRIVSLPCTLHQLTLVVCWCWWCNSLDQCSLLGGLHLGPSWNTAYELWIVTFRICSYLWSHFHRQPNYNYTYTLRFHDIHPLFQYSLEQVWCHGSWT